MPTGYTYKLVNQGQSFPEFSMRCARAFSALAHMMDQPMDAPIPDVFKPSDYYTKALQEAQETLAHLERMTPQQAVAYGDAKRREEIEMTNAPPAKQVAERARLYAMQTQVNAWIPPSSDHDSLKRFMLDQINISLNDAGYAESNEVETDSKSCTGYYHDALIYARIDVSACTEELEKQRQRCARNTNWVRLLRESL